MPNPNDPPRVRGPQRFIAQRVKFHAARRFALTGLTADRLDQDGPPVSKAYLDRMAVEMVAEVVAQTNERIVIHEEWPETWWDAFKLRWFPSWLEKRYPAAMRAIHVDRPIFGRTCPHLATDPPSKHVAFLSGEYRP